MLRLVVIGLLILGIILFFVFGIIGPIFKKKTSSEEPLHEIDEMVQQSEKIAQAKEIVTKKVATKERKIKTVKNNLKK